MTASAPVARRTPGWFESLAADAVGVLLFATLGRLSHSEGLGPIGVLATAWPFLAGAGLGWALVLSGLLRGVGVRPAPSPWRTGVVVWVSAVAFGMILRSQVAHGGVQVSFVIVAAIFIGLVTVGWRLAFARHG